MERGEIPPRPGVVRLIRELQTAGIRLAIATTTTPANVDALLSHTLHALPPGTFEVIGAGDIPITGSLYVIAKDWKFGVSKDCSA